MVQFHLFFYYLYKFLLIFLAKAWGQSRKLIEKNPINLYTGFVGVDKSMFLYSASAEKTLSFLSIRRRDHNRQKMKTSAAPLAIITLLVSYD